MSRVVLITGSRDWGEKGPYPEIDKEILEKYLSKLLNHGDTLIHGACPTGADKLADEWAQKNSVEIKRFPPDKTLGKKGYYLRNKAMVDMKPDYVLGFILGESRGTSMTLELAQKSNLKIGVVYASGTLINGALFSRDLRV